MLSLCQLTGRNFTRLTENVRKVGFESPQIIANALYIGEKKRVFHDSTRELLIPMLIGKTAAVLYRNFGTFDCTGCLQQAGNF